MKKKLLPFILGCAMVAAMPLAAHADPEVPDVPAGAVDSLNGFANFEATGTLNDTPDQELNAVTFEDSTTGTGSTVGNTRQAQSTTSAAYGATYNNEKGANFTEADPNTNNDGFSDTTPSPRTDLETAIPGFTMTIPANTVLPFGATNWNIGLLEIDATDFMNPDKVGVILTKEDFTKANTANPSTNQTITFDIATSKGGTSVASTFNSNDEIVTTDAKILKFYQTGTRGTNFPYTYTGLSHSDYDAGNVVDIHEGKHIWLSSSDWSGKEAGRYEGSITFTAYIINGELVENDDATTAPYPKTIGENATTHELEVTSWYNDTPAQP